MATDLAKLVVRMEAQTARYQSELEKANGKLSRFEKRQKKSIANISKGFKTLGVALAGVGIGKFIGSIAKATAAQEQAVAQLQQGLRSTGEAVGFNLQQLTQYAAELQRVTTFGDEQFIQAAAQLVSFTKIQGDEFKRTLELAGDLSVRFGTDLKSSVLQLGKALNDPVANLSALSRSGIQFTQSQKDLVKSLVETGRQAEAQRVILQELEVQFGGSARAARDTFGGALQGLNNTLGDLMESQSGLPGAKTAIEELTQALSSQSFATAFDAFVSGMVKLASLSASALTGFVRAIEKLSILFNGGAVAADDLANVIAEKQQQLQSLEEKANRSRSNAGRNRINLLRQEIAELERKFALINNNVAALPDAQGNLPSQPGIGADKKPPAKKSFAAAADKFNFLGPDDLEKKSPDAAVAQFEESFQQLDAIVAERTNTMADNISGALMRGFDGGFDGILSGFGNMIAAMIQQWIQSGITQLIGNFLVPGSGAAGGGLFGKLLGFASGGSFMVGGQGGTDANLVAFRATRGERVTVETPQQQMQGGAVNINISALDTQTGLEWLMRNRGGVYSAARSAAGDQGRAI